MARIGILALQGAFIEHERMLREMGAECIEIRNKKQLAEPISGLVLPGGESTVQRKQNGFQHGTTSWFCRRSYA